MYSNLSLNLQIFTWIWPQRAHFNCFLALNYRRLTFTCGHDAVWHISIWPLCNVPYALCGRNKGKQMGWSTINESMKSHIKGSSSTPLSSLSYDPAPEPIIQTHPVFQNRSSLVLQLDNLLLAWLIHTPFLSPSLAPGRKETETRGFASR